MQRICLTAHMRLDKVLIISTLSMMLCLTYVVAAFNRTFLCACRTVAHDCIKPTLCLDDANIEASGAL